MGNMTKKIYTTEQLTATTTSAINDLPWVARTEELFILGPNTFDGTYAFGVNLNDHANTEGFVASPDDQWGVAAFVYPEQNAALNLALTTVETMAAEGETVIKDVSWFTERTNDNEESDSGTV